MFFALRVDCIVPNPTVEHYHQDPSFQKFLSELKLIIDHKDWNEFQKKLDRNLVNGFDQPSGVSAFLEIWEKSEIFWLIMERIVQMGATKKSKYKYVLPAMPSNWPSGLDIYQHGYITGTRVNIRSDPTVKSERVTQLTHEIVRVDFERSASSMISNSNLDENPIDEIDWYYIESLDGEKCGFVYWKYFWNPAFYRMIIEQSNGSWMITAFVAGD